MEIRTPLQHFSGLHPPCIITNDKDNLIIPPDFKILNIPD